MKIFFRFTLVVLMTIGFGINSVSTITKAFYHQGHCVDKLVFYFDQMPKVQVKQIAGKQVYLLESVQVGAEAWQNLDTIKQLPVKYNLNFGLKRQNFEIIFDLSEQLIEALSLAKFKPISQPAGLVIRILHEADRQPSFCARRIGNREIVLDFGHGGSDIGAQYGKIMEKNVVRQVGLKLAKLLTEHGYTVHLTRTGDEFVPLDQRTYFANLHTQASLFISLHANHAPNQKIIGLETYYMHHDLFYGLDLLNTQAVVDLSLNSMNLAQLVHQNLLQEVTGYKLVDRQVKKSVSQVLLGVEMPAILIELGFLSNPKEARQLHSPKYQMQLATGIYHGINAFFAQ